MRTRNPPKLIMNISLIMQLIMSCLVFQCGTMGTCSYVLTGTERGMEETFGSTCHGAGRAKSRAGSRRQMDYTEVLEALQSKGIAIRVASPKLVMEEAPHSHTRT